MQNKVPDPHLEEIIISVLSEGILSKASVLCFFYLFFF